MVSKGQSPPDQLESNYFHLPLGCLKFMLFSAMKIAGVILHPLHRLSVRPGAIPAKKVTAQPNPAICTELSSMQKPRGGVCAKTYSEKLKCIKNKSDVCSWGSACWGGAGTPPQPGSWSLSWLPSSDPLGRSKHRFIFTHLVLRNWCVISYRAVGLVPTSPHERALPDVWCCCYWFSLQNYGCGILLSPEMRLLERCVLGSRGTAVNSTFLKISC